MWWRRILAAAAAAALGAALVARGPAPTLIMGGGPVAGLETPTPRSVLSDRGALPGGGRTPSGPTPENVRVTLDTDRGAYTEAGGGTDETTEACSTGRRGQS